MPAPACLYFYEGQVSQYGNLIEKDWKAMTYAHSEEEAYRNFIFQFKQEHAMPAWYHIDLIDEIDYVIRILKKGE